MTIWEAVGFGLTTGLLMSAHCVGMCGVFVAGYSAGGSRWGDHLLFNAGRFAVFTLLGLVGGAIGSALDLAGGLAGLTQVASVVAGSLLLVYAAAMLGWLPGREKLELEPVVTESGWFRRNLLRALASRSRWRALAIGALVGFLPCGALHGMVLAAAATGSAAIGGATLAAYAVGTTPALFAFGVIARTLSAATRRWMVQAGAYLMLVMACETLFRALTGGSLIGGVVIALVERFRLSASP